MSVPPLPDLDALSLDELKKLVVQLLVEVTALREENRQLRAENARLKDLPKKPKLAPGGMDKATEPNKRARTRQARRQRCKRQSGRRTPPVTEERTLVIEAPAGSRRRGFEPFTVQDLILAPQVIRFRRERWLTPEGQEIVAPLPPEVSGHFGPGIVRYVLMQHMCKCRVNTPQIGRMNFPQADATARLGSRRLGAVQPLIAHSSLSRLREGLGGHTWGTRHDSRSRPPGFERVGDRAPDRPGSQNHPQVRRQGTGTARLHATATAADPRRSL